LTSVGSIRADVSKRLLILAAVLPLLAAACGEAAEPHVDLGDGARFVPIVVDGLEDVGQGASVAVTAEGRPFVAYFGFERELEEGQVRPIRPIGAPFLPGVMLASQSPEGFWDRGAIVMQEPERQPVGVRLPFGPEAVADLDITPENVNGTAIAVADDGAAHVAWTAGGGVWYGTSAADADAAYEQVFDYGNQLSQAGPIGQPAIVLDDGGEPWVAYAVNAAAGIEVHVATPNGDAWDDEVVFTAQRCNGCPQPGVTALGVTDDGPMVAFIDTQASVLRTGTLQGGSWTVRPRPVGDDAHGLSMTVVDGQPVMAYYADGALHVLEGGRDAEVATVGQDVEQEGGVLTPTTGVADVEGTLYVAWQDAEGVRLAAAEGGGFTDVETIATRGGVTPALAAGPEGVLYLAWYDAQEQNMMLAAYGEVGEIELAAPSPPVEVELGGETDTACGEDGQIVLDVVAQGIQWDKNCLVGPANEPFTIDIDNQDEGIPHNLHLFTEQGGDSIAMTPLESGIVQQTLDVDPLDPGSYFFICDAHPNMTGTLAAIEGGGGGGAEGQGEGGAEGEGDAAA
jgi:hypothetical protein